MWPKNCEVASLALRGLLAHESPPPNMKPPPNLLMLHVRNILKYTTVGVSDVGRGGRGIFNIRGRGLGLVLRGPQEDGPEALLLKIASPTQPRAAIFSFFSSEYAAKIWPGLQFEFDLSVKHVPQGLLEDTKLISTLIRMSILFVFKLHAIKNWLTASRTGTEVRHPRSTSQ